MCCMWRRRLRRLSGGGGHLRSCGHTLKWGPLRRRAQYGMTALIGAGWLGRADCARLLLDAGADKNAKDEVRAIAGVGVCGGVATGLVAMSWCER